MRTARFSTITASYPRLRIAVVGDFCLDRYLEIDPARGETSIETGLPVYNVVRIRSQAGAAGTILNNLVALEIGEIYPVGFCGEDGEGYELRRAFASLANVNLAHFLSTPLRRTFTYCKPLVIEPGQPPRELSRLDSKNWTLTPLDLQRELAARVSELASHVDALILMDQVDEPETGVVTQLVREAVGSLVRRPWSVTAGRSQRTTDHGQRPLILADSRRGLQDFPPLAFKMNAAELARLVGAVGRTSSPSCDLEDVKTHAAQLAARNGQPVFVTLAERGMIGALPGASAEHVPAFPVHGSIDIVGAGDAVTANLAAALAAGAELREAMQLAMAAASIVIHQLGTTGTASVAEMAPLLEGIPRAC